MKQSNYHARAIELDPNNHVAYMLLSLDYASDAQYENAEKAAKNLFP